MNRAIKIKFGDRVHLHSKNGVYTIHQILQYGDVLITTNHWKREFERGDRKSIYQRIKQDDIKCHFIPNSNPGESLKRARQRALNKLTETEKQLLGVK